MALTKISTGGVKDDTASQAKIADEAVDEARLQISNAGTNGQFLSKQSGNTGGLTWADVTIPDADKCIEGNTSVEAVDTGSDGHVKITTEGTERVRIIADGKVGIGVNDPDSNVEINRGSEGKYLTIGGDDANNARGLTFTSSTGGTGSNGALHTINAKSGNGAIGLATAGTERFRIANSGQLGLSLIHI